MIPPDDLEYLLKLTLRDDKTVELELGTVQEDDYPMVEYVL